ncbi:MAG: ABC transporter ATP-binding protein [Clostridiales bacterium]|nr:ABC transporter ATP-binding protein [Clostridiales bacterium]
MPEIIRINKLYKIYHQGTNEIRALNGVSLTVNQGEFLAIVGHSGSGKSTLMNILGCLDAPTAGEYFLEGYDVASLNDNRLSDIRNRYIGFIFQGFNLIAGLTALENVELPLIYRGMRRDQRHKAAIESLERVGLGNRMHHRPAEMSGGQQQRVAIARAIAAHPPLILADEPTGNLDTVSGMEVINTLLDLNNEGRTVILITHDRDIASLAKRIISIKDGRIISDQITESAVS